MDIMNNMNEYYPLLMEEDDDEGYVRNNNSDSRNGHEERPSRSQPSKQMAAIFIMCKNNQWDNVLNSLKSNPDFITKSMAMTNNIETSVLHQAITSKGSLQARTNVIDYILDVKPEAAAKLNGYQSLPLHVICQRNTRMSAKTKERLITKLVAKYPQALNQTGGVGKRTPIHIVFTDYVSLELTALMIDTGKNVAESMNVPNACFIKDKNGNLPHHVACSRHVSPGKLEKLLEVNPGALLAENDQKATLLRLATSTATKAHPNHALIKYLHQKMKYADHHHQSVDSRHGTPASGIKSPSRKDYDPIKMETPIAPNHDQYHISDPSPSPGPGMHSLTAAVTYAAAASPGYAAHVGQVAHSRLKVKREGQNENSKRQPSRRNKQAKAPFAVQQLTNNHQNSFLLSPIPLDTVYEGPAFDHEPNQVPGDANLLLQFARGGSPTENDCVEV